MKRADALFDEADFGKALREYLAAQSLDPSLPRATQKVQLLTKLRDSDLYFKEGQDYEKNNKPKEAYRSYKQALSIYPDNKEAKASYDRLRQSKRTKMDGFELNLKSNKPITLKFKDARTRDVFSILSQLSGINFIFDDTVKDQNITIFLENATFQQAMDIITNLSKLGKKVLNESTIILYPRTPDKTKQYDELVVKTMYLTTLEAKKAVNLLRTMLQLKKIYVNEDLNALVIRDTPEMVDVAQKIIDANDIPEAEVLLDIEVLQLTKKDEVNFGLALSRYAISVAGTSPSNQFLSDTLVNSTTSSGGTGVTTSPVLDPAQQLLQLFSWNKYGAFMTVPSATYNFGKSISNGEVLSNPKVRVKNREKTKFNVGSRVPITTTSTNGTVGGLNVNVQYVDVGVKVNAEPTIQLNNEITIKLSLEVSNILSQQNIGGKDSLTTVVTIGTRNVDTVLNLKDGETSIIGGLLEDSVNKSKQKIWLIGDIPIIGPLLSNNSDTKTKGELILAITPRIVRSLMIPDSDVSSFWSGREDEPSATNPYANFAPETDFDKVDSSQAPTKDPAAPTGAPPAAQPGRRPAAPPALAAPAVIERGSMSLQVPASVTVGQQFTVEVKADGVKELYSAPFNLIYDPIFAEFVGAAEGGFLKQDGKPTTFSAVNDPAGGKVSVVLHRNGDVGGVTGNGVLLTATFKAKNVGPLNLGFSSVNFTEVAGKNLPMVPYNVLVDVK
jgi:general secretion pathway protein D